MGATTDYQENVSVNQGAHTAIHRLHGSADWNECSPPCIYSPDSIGFREGPNISTWDQHEVFSTGVGGCSGAQNNYTFDKSLVADASRVFRAYLTMGIDSGASCPLSFTVLGSWISYKTYAVTATASTPTSSAVTNNSATIACNYFPNTNESTADVKLQYRKFGDVTWIDAGATDVGKQGYSQLAISRGLTGLLGNTTYEFRLSMTRNTSNATTFTSSVSTFTTLPDEPDIVTTAASSVASTSAQLNGTVDPNGISVRVRFGWGTSDAGSGTWANYTSYQNFSGDGVQAFSAIISGLTASTGYFFRALVEYPSPGYGTLKQGSTLSFSTLSDPLVDSVRSVMPDYQDFDRKYGVATTIYFVVPVPGATSPDLFYTGAAVWAGAAESKISKDGGAFADTTNDPVQITGGLYSLALTVAEMQHSQAFIILHDTGGAVRDVLLRTRTELLLGNVDIDAASGSKSNTSALKLTGFGTGHGLEAIKGATGRDISGVIAQHFVREGLAQAGGGAAEIKLDSGASATDNWYNTLVCDLVSGTGAGQSRVGIAYNGTTKILTVDAAWNQNPDGTTRFCLRGSSRTWEVPNLVIAGVASELAAVPTAGAPAGQKLQFVFQRFGFKITQTATIQTWFKSDSSTSLGTRSVSDSGSVQTIAKLS
jgi:hypothetical protein